MDPGTSEFLEVAGKKGDKKDDRHLHCHRTRYPMAMMLSMAATAPDSGIPMTGWPSWLAFCGVTLCVGHVLVQIWLLCCRRGCMQHLGFIIGSISHASPTGLIQISIPLHYIVIIGSYVGRWSCMFIGSFMVGNQVGCWKHFFMSILVCVT